MTTKGYKKSSISLFGAVSFFLLVAFVMQIAILAYDYICQRTSDTSLIAVLILILIFILAAFCTVCDFKVRIDIQHSHDKYDEFDIIAENLNAMAAELGKSEVLKNDFISNVSHELKTPLAVIGNYASALADPSLDEQSREKYAKTLVLASGRLSGLVTDILKLNKLQNQEIKPELSYFNLADTLAECVIGFEGKIEEKDITLECDIDDVFITSSHSLLEIVFTNLISNAVKFTEPGGRVSVSLNELNGRAVISVSDTGPGMSREVGMRIFEQFYQGDTSHASEGNGLGLALVKKVIDILGGEISVTSEIGKGSRFTVIIKK